MKNKIMNLDKHIRKIPNWPKEGILFYDITTALENGEVFKWMIDELAENFRDQKIDKIVGIDARGFLLAAGLAYKWGIGISLVRKKGKLPYEVIRKDYVLEYASNTIEMHKDTIKPGETVLVIDDLVATGGTITAACGLVEEMGGEVVGVGFVIDLPFLGGSKKLGKYKTVSLVSYDSETVKNNVCATK